MQHAMAGNEEGTFSQQIWLDELAGGGRVERGQALQDGVGNILGKKRGKRRPLLFCLTYMMQNTNLILIADLKAPSPPFLLLHLLNQSSRPGATSPPGAVLPAWLGRQLPPPVKQMECFIHHTLGKTGAFLIFYRSFS